MHMAVNDSRLERAETLRCEYKQPLIPEDQIFREN